MSAATALLLGQAALSFAASPFVEELHRAQARDADDPERIEFATRAIREWEPTDGKPLLAAARFARAEGRAAKIDDAAVEDDLNAALELDPLNEKAKLMRAKARVGLGAGRLAERDVLDYLSARPDDAEGWLTLGDARALQGGEKAEKPARDAYGKAGALLGPDDPRPGLGIGRAYLAARAYKDALAALSQAAERPGKKRGEILSERARAYSALGDWAAAHDDLGRAVPELERRLEDVRRIGAVRRAQDRVRGTLADAYFRLGLSDEALSRKEQALQDHRSACDLGHAAACARVRSLSKPEPAAAPAPKPAPKPKRKKNPKGDGGERIYAN